MAAPSRKKNSHWHYPVVSGRKRQLSDEDYRILIPASLAPKVIGTGGSSIKKINKATKAVDERARIMIYHEQLVGGPLMEGAADRVLGIKAKLEALEIAVKMLIPFLQLPGRSEKKVKSELRLMVPYHCCANVVGTGGSNIKRIQEETGSFIQTYKVSLPYSQERLVRIQHFEVDALLKTAMQIWKSIAAFKKDEPIILYEPIWFEEGSFDNTGSYMDYHFFNPNDASSFTHYAGRGKKGGSKRGSRGNSRGGSQGSSRGGFNQNNRAGNNVYKYPQPEHYAEYNYGQDYYEEPAACWEGPYDEDGFTDSYFDTDQYAEALAEGIAIGMKQAISMGLVKGTQKSTDSGNGLAGPKDAGSIKPAAKGGKSGRGKKN